MIVTDPDGDGMRLLLQTGILPPIFDCPPSAWGRYAARIAAGRAGCVRRSFPRSCLVLGWPTEDEVYASSTLGIFLRDFTFGHANEVAAVARAHLVAPAARVPLLGQGLVKQ